MRFKSLFPLAGVLLCALAVIAPAAEAGVIQYEISLTTTALPGSAKFIDFQFNPAAGSPLSASASIDSISATGYTFDESTTVFSAGVTGSRLSLPISIPNSDATNYYAQGVGGFGSFFDVFVTLSGDAIGGTGTAGSSFYVILEDASGSSIFPASGVAGDVARIVVNADGTTSGSGDQFDGGFAAVAIAPAVPEPSTLVLGLGAGLWFAVRRLRASN